MRVVVMPAAVDLLLEQRNLVKELKSRPRPDTVLEITGCVGMCYLEPIVDIYDDCGQLHRFT